MIPLMRRSSSRARAGLVPWQMRLYPSPLRPGPIPAAISLFLLRKILRSPVVEPHGARVQRFCRLSGRKARGGGGKRCLRLPVTNVIRVPWRVSKRVVCQDPLRHYLAGSGGVA